MQNSLVISAFDSLQSLIIDCGALMSIKSFEVSNNPNLASIKLGDGIINKNNNVVNGVLSNTKSINLTSITLLFDSIFRITSSTNS